MASNDYAFITEWRVEAPPELVYDILIEGEDLPRWWPEVYLSAKAERPPDGGTIGTRLELHTRGWLPYTLKWTAETTRADRPSGFALRATGDFDGTGVWTFTPDRSGTHIRFDWTLRAEKPILRSLSFLLKPVFSWNHRWAMAKGYENLQREVRRRSVASASVSP